MCKVTYSAKYTFSSVAVFFTYSKAFELRISKADFGPKLFLSGNIKKLLISPWFPPKQVISPLTLSLLRLERRRSHYSSKEALQRFGTSETFNFHTFFILTVLFWIIQQWYWIRHITFYDSDFRFVINDPNKTSIQKFVHIVDIWYFGCHIGFAIFIFVILTFDS